VAKKFHLIVAADDVSQGKPDPEGFLTAVRLLNRDHVPPSEILLQEECLAIEDSPWGIEAAHKAGIKCLAVMSSYDRERLQRADRVVPNLRTLKMEEIEDLFIRS
jgi:beta-phosphoglucomutase-like phosphatase (HAD superfamily)